MLKPQDQYPLVNNAMTSNSDGEIDENSTDTIQGESSGTQGKPNDEQNKISYSGIVLTEVDENVDQAIQGNRFIVGNGERGNNKQAIDHNELIPEKEADDTMLKISDKDNALTDLDTTQPMNDERMQMLYAVEKEEQITPDESLQESVQQMSEKEADDAMVKISDKDNGPTDLDTTQPMNDERMQMLDAMEKENEQVTKHEEQIAPDGSLQESVQQMPEKEADDTMVKISDKDNALTALDTTQPVNDERMQMLDAVVKENVQVTKHEKQIAPDGSLQESVQLGDHVYRFCSFAGIPGVIQHHGIVTELNEETLTVVDFDNLIRGDGDALKSFFIKRRRGRVHIYEKENSHEWKFVTYKAGYIARCVGRSGTCTSVDSDKPGFVLSRVKFLLDKRDKLPKYHFLHANSECVAVWCKTGTWATLQASSLLHTYAAGQVKSASTLALYVSSQQVTVPSAGLWGYLGYTTKVSLLSTQPYLLPAVAGYGLITIGGPMWILAKCKNILNKTTETMNHEFWEEALRQPDTFAECMTNWSQL